MLLFNCRGECRSAYLLVHFNTSNVTIQRILYSPVPSLTVNFNTSNVTIQLYHTCIITPFPNNFNTSNVTIQQRYLRKYSTILRISIHLMLLFNCTSDRSKSNLCLISIHLMLLFNVYITIKRRLIKKFQYI